MPPTPPPPPYLPPPLAPPPPGTWALYPSQYRSQVNACPAGTTSPSEDDCFHAAKEALNATGEPHFRAPSNDAPHLFGNYIVTRTDYPPGCLVHTRTAEIIYNRASSGTNRNAYYKLVCDMVPGSQGSADYSADTGKLCPRKRYQCAGDTGGCERMYSFVSDEMTSNTYYWSEESCRQQVQINGDGRVSIVDLDSMYDPTVAEGPHGTSYARNWANSQNWFRVRWADGHFPAAISGCSSACSIVAGGLGETCVCDIDVATSAVFTDPSYVPSQAEIEAQLSIGSMAPAHFDVGTYTQCFTTECIVAAQLCSTSNCDVAPGYVEVHTRGTSEAPVYDMTTIFSIVVNQTTPFNGRRMYFANKASTVSIASSTSSTAYSFRNPPHIMSIVDPSQRDAIYETDSVIDELFYHQNTAPFVAFRMIQRMATSNPSPRYVAAVVDAWKTGAYGGHAFSGEYGDLAATVAAILLDREARSLVLTADPTHGQLREPLLKLLHLMRAMEYVPRNGMAVDFGDIVSQIGQGTYRSPGVFSFFLPEYQPEGALVGANLVAPEGMLGVLPYVIGFLDGIMSLVHHGLTNCRGGLGSSTVDGGADLCGTDHGDVGPEAWSTEMNNPGYLTFSPTDATSAEAVIDELDVLLAAGRLRNDPFQRSVILEEYIWHVNRTACPVERTDLCGRLTPGDTMNPGEYIVNSNGEQLCFSYDGVVRHIDSSGVEVYSTGSETRELGVILRYYDSSTHYRQGNAIAVGNIRWDANNERYYTSSNAYETRDFEAGNYKAFQNFMSGPCDSQDSNWFNLHTVYGFWVWGLSEATIWSTDVCNAASTCGSPAPSSPSAAYLAQRARTDSKYAVRVAQKAIAASAAFAVTNDAATTEVDLPPPRTSATTVPRPYKAIVILFLAGGADTHNMLIPVANCDSRDVATQYINARGAMAKDLNSVLQISVTPAGSQPCDTFGIHPSFTFLKSLYDGGNASFFANVGPLIEPTTKAQFIDKSTEMPPQLFAHNIQQQVARTVHPQETTGKTGVVGRMLQAMEDQAVANGEVPFTLGAYSVVSNREIFRSGPVEPVLLSSTSGMLRYQGSELTYMSTAGDQGLIQPERVRSMEAMNNLTRKKAGSYFASTHNNVVRNSLADSERIGNLLEQVTLTQSWTSAISSAPGAIGGDIIRQLEQVSKVIASRNALGAERDVFYIEMGGFDTHSDTTSLVDQSFQVINTGLETFTAEMKAQGVWDNVVLQQLSEFGRTMTTNGGGSDHAYGGNQYVIGGSVKGGLIHGNFPELRVDGPNSISGTGVMLPSSPWEKIWTPLISWFGVQDDRFTEVLPNYNRFSSAELSSRGDVYL